jgi:hypothetical protein
VVLLCFNRVTHLTALSILIKFTDEHIITVSKQAYHSIQPRLVKARHYSTPSHLQHQQQQQQQQFMYSVTFVKLCVKICDQTSVMQLLPLPLALLMVLCSARSAVLCGATNADTAMVLLWCVSVSGDIDSSS